ncbi:MAG: hypothetical protein LBI54_06960 [Lachnospiraceae bacterium]|nr:hypothetical protein [Lachnospiraceae bacterium]
MTKQTLAEFLDKEIICRQPERLHIWEKRPLLAQLMDISIEVEKMINNKATEQLEQIHNICTLIYANANILEGTKYELKVAEWELWDYLCWDNEWNNDDKSIMQWWNQWIYHINYDLI